MGFLSIAKSLLHNKDFIKGSDIIRFTNENLNYIFLVLFNASVAWTSELNKFSEHFITLSL